MVKGIFHHKLFRLEYAPIWILLLSFLLRLPVYLIHTFGYWYDEIIFLSIAKLPFSQMFDTLLAEPKPPGAYVLFHYLPTDNALTTRLALMVAAYTLTGIALWYGYATRVIQHYKLQLGLALFISSFSFLRLTSYVKPYEVVGVTLTIFFLFVALTVVKNRSTNASNRHVFLLHTIVFAALFFNYIAYLFIMISLAVITIVLRKRKLTLWLFALQLIIIGLYTVFFAYEQSHLIRERSIWQFEINNSLLYVLEWHLFGFFNPTFVTDIATGIFLWCLFQSAYHRRNFSEKWFYVGITITLTFFLIIGYKLNLLTQYRYSYSILLILSVLAGWGLYSFKTKQAITVILAIFFFLGIFVHARNYRQIEEHYQKTTSLVSELLKQNADVGVLSNIPLMSYVMKMEYFINNESFIPVIPYLGGILPTTYISKELLLTNLPVLTIENREKHIIDQLQKSEQRNFLFLHYGYQISTYYLDPDQALLDVLINNCHLSLFRSSNFVGVYEFDTCKFNE